MNNKQQEARKRLAVRPTLNDIRWEEVESLLHAVGARIIPGRGSHIKVAIGKSKVGLVRPHKGSVMAEWAIKALDEFLEGFGL